MPRPLTPSPRCHRPQVAVLYSSDYGFSDRLSQTLARGVTKVRARVAAGGWRLAAAAWLPTACQV